MARVIKQHNLQAEEDKLFDHVIFCTNVTYADGAFKSGGCHFIITTACLSQIADSQSAFQSCPTN